ncbi:MAG: hypothetical protein Q8O94_03345 [bacterium]|nr:hypothetical protein [bacterium]
MSVWGAFSIVAIVCFAIGGISVGIYTGSFFLGLAVFSFCTGALCAATAVKGMKGK